MKLKELLKHCAAWIFQEDEDYRDPETEKYFQAYFNAEQNIEDTPEDDGIEIASFARSRTEEKEKMPPLPSSFWNKADQIPAGPDHLSVLPVSSVQPKEKAPVPVKTETIQKKTKPAQPVRKTRKQLSSWRHQTMLQAFEWYLPADGKLWRQLGAQAENLHGTGFTSAWLPPAYKGHSGKEDVGYGVYDLYDLGEFNQKGSIRTKYGTREQYLKAVQQLQKHKIQVLADIVIDHRMGADETEVLQARSVDGGNRNRIISDFYAAKVWSRFTFPGRNGKYSRFLWDASCFNAADYNAFNGRHDIMLFKDKSWNENVSREFGNYDYVMGMCTDFHQPEVVDELHRWGKWYLKTTKVSGFRLDCLKSIDSSFFQPWLKNLEQEAGMPLLTVGEYWSGNIEELHGYLRTVQYSMRLFDIPLHYHFFDCSKSHGQYDVRRLFEGTLSQREPEYAVAFVDNHDTQPMQALCSWVEDWFKTAAYASILLYKSKNPCVFWGDLHGIEKSGNPPVTLLKEMLWIRSRILGEEVIDLFDEDPQKACWLVNGDHPVLVLFTIGDRKTKKVKFSHLAGTVFADAANPEVKITLNTQGEGEFFCSPGCCSVYLPETDLRAMQKDLKIY